jgi:2'-5' RNA ligase
MNGVVSLLDAAHTAKVEELWRTLDQRFGVRGVSVTPYPHFSYHVARDYDVVKLEAALRGFAAQRKKLTVRCAGLGVFTGPQPTIYIPVVRTESLSQLHSSLWKRIEGLGTGVVEHYSPESWVPHITIGFGDVTPSILPEIMRSLSDRGFAWEIEIDNLAIIHDTGSRQELRCRFDFGSRE